MHTPFGKTTWKVDAALIWYGAISFGTSAITWLFGVLEGWGVTISFLFALAALPLAFVSCILFRYWREINNAIRGFFGAESAAAALIVPEQINHKDDNSDIDKGSPPGYDDLLSFFLSYLEPLIKAHLALHEGIIRAGVGNDKIRDLALQSICDETLYRSLSFAASKMAQSPAERPSLYELTVSTHNCEFSYKDCIEGAEALACSLGLDIKADERLFSLWDDWRIKHNALVVEYERIKRDQRLGILFRPLRESKWGGPIPGA